MIFRLLNCLPPFRAFRRWLVLRKVGDPQTAWLRFGQPLRHGAPRTADATDLDAGVGIALPLDGDRGERDEATDYIDDHPGYP